MPRGADRRARASTSTTTWSSCGSRCRRPSASGSPRSASMRPRALEIALREWTPGERDFDVQARVAGKLERVGAFGACLIVGGDERVERFRHPLAAGRPMHRLVMAVVVAERHGLHAAATRFACAGGLPTASGRARAPRSPSRARSWPRAAGRDLRRRAGRARTGVRGGRAPRRVARATTRAARSATASASSRSCRRRPRAAGYDADRAGPRAGLESERRRRRQGEDTYLVETHDLRRLTDTGAWPLEDGRPAVLDITSGEARVKADDALTRLQAGWTRARRSRTARTSASRSRASKGRTCSRR